jgi:nitrate reductase gamma subunit
MMPDGKRFLIRRGVAQNAAARIRTLNSDIFLLSLMSFPVITGKLFSFFAQNKNGS